MKLKRKKGESNYYIWEGLTEGKLLAILYALESREKDGVLTPVAQDCLTFLRNHREAGKAFMTIFKTD